jgi:hypothetical protein
VGVDLFDGHVTHLLRPQQLGITAAAVFLVSPGAQQSSAPGEKKKPAAVRWLSQTFVLFGTATYADEVSAIGKTFCRRNNKLNLNIAGHRDKQYCSESRRQRTN